MYCIFPQNKFFSLEINKFLGCLASKFQDFKTSKRKSVKLFKFWKFKTFKKIYQFSISYFMDIDLICNVKICLDGSSSCVGACLFQNIQHVRFPKF